MAVETRTVHFSIDPALAAYLAWIEAEGRPMVLEEYDLFAAGYRACCGDREPLEASDD